MLPISLTGHHCEITEPLREYVHKKMTRLERHTDDITNIHIVLTVEKMRQIAKANIDVRGNTLHATTEHEDMYAAIDALIDTLVQQAERHKQKPHSKKHNGNDATPFEE